jgi:hypothetical protein
VAVGRTGWSAEPATLRDGLRPLAKYIQVLVEQEKQDSVAVGEFSPPPRQKNMNIREGIAGELRSLLEKDFKLKVKDDAQLFVRGSYAYVDSKRDADLKVIQVRAELANAQNQVIGIKANLQMRLKLDSEKPPEYNQTDGGKKPPGSPKRPADKQPLKGDVKPQNPVEIDSTKVVAEATGITGALAENGSKAERNKQVQKLTQEPSYYTEGTRIRSSQTSPYAVEILVQKPLPERKGPNLTLADYDRAEPCHPSDHDGFQKGTAFVQLNKDELYQVKFYNDSQEDVAVSLSIDGLDEFYFSKVRGPDGQPKYSRWIVHPKDYVDPNGWKYNGTLLVEGWHKSDEPTDNVLSFRVTELGQGAVAGEGIKAQGNVGVIHAQFAHCYQKGKRPSGRGTGDFATGFGAARTISQTVVEYEFDPPHDFVSVRYTLRPELPDDPGKAKLPQ